MASFRTVGRWRRWVCFAGGGPDMLPLEDSGKHGTGRLALFRRRPEGICELPRRLAAARIPYMSDPQVHLNGRLVAAAEAVVSIFDAGLLHGASAFTTMLAHKGKVFRLERHMKRLMETCRQIGLRTTATEEGLAAAAEEVLRANGLAEARSRCRAVSRGTRLRARLLICVSACARSGDMSDSAARAPHRRRGTRRLVTCTPLAMGTQWPERETESVSMTGSVW